jgi:ribose transport system substrate-binding protein
MGPMKRLLLAALLIAGCGPSTRKTTIAVIPKGTTHVFWKSVHAGAVKAGQELAVEVIWKGPLKEDDREDQIKVVENFVNQRVSGIVLAPLDDAALVGPVEDAARSKIPVVIIDSDLKSEKHVSFVATDNVKGGELAGQEMARLLGGKGKVVLLRYQEGSASTMNREKGFLDALARHPGIEVVSKDQYAGATTATAIAASENLLQRFKAGGGLSVDGLFCPNESSAAGMLTVLQSSGLAGQVKFIGFDSSVQLLKAIEDGQLHATVVQDPITMGYLGVKSMVRHLRGEAVERRVDTGATLVTPANLKEPRIRDLVDPDAFKKWLKE